MNEKTEVEKHYLSGVSIWALAFGCVIGWGSFVMPKTDFLPDAGPVGTIIGIVIAAIIGIIICNNYSWLVQKFPESCSSYQFTKNILGEDHAFLAAWSLELAYISLLWANATAFILLGRYAIGDMLQWGFHYKVAEYDVYFGEVLVTIFIQVIFGLISCYFKKFANFMRTILAIILFSSVVALFFGVVINLGFANMFSPAFSDREPIGMQILNISVLAPWLFVGFETVTHSVGQTVFSNKKIFSYAALGILMGMIVYILLALTCTAAVPEGFSNWYDYIANINNFHGIESMPVFFNAKKAMGDWGIKLVGLAAFSALTTSVLGFHRAASWVLMTMAKSKLLPERFARLSKDGIPVNAGLLIMVLSIPIPFLGRTAIGWNADVSTLSVSIVYAYISICAFLTSKGVRRIRIFGILGIISSITILFFLLIPNIFAVNSLAKESYFMLASWCIAGMLFYWYIFHNDKENRFGKSTVMWLIMLFLLLFSSNIWTRLDSQNKIEQILGSSNSSVKAIMSQSSLIHILIIVFGLYIVFNLFLTMIKRQKELDFQVIQAKERNKAKTDFLSNMSHDIRTPMNAIVGFTDLALLDVSNVKQVEEYLKKIKTSSAHLLSLINEVLEMSRIESGKIELNEELVNIKELIDNLKTFIIGQIDSKNQELFIDTSKVTDEFIFCDKLRLNQILLNITSNAVKYTGSGGKISISVAQISVLQNDKAEYEFRIKDNGIGMSQEFAVNIFEAFEREKNSTVNGIQGTGLGMAITKKLVDLMNGNIAIDTAPGKGSEFIVTICFKVGEGRQLQNKSDIKIDKSFFVGKRLLLVDDMLINRQIAMMMLKNYGFEIEEAENGKEAFDKIQSSGKKYYDAVLMDVQMPVMNGYEATKAIRSLDDKDKADIPIFAMTANAFDEDKKNALEAGMTGHISKPIDIELLVRILAEALVISHKD